MPKKYKRKKRKRKREIYQKARVWRTPDIDQKGVYSKGWRCGDKGYDLRAVGDTLNYIGVYGLGGKCIDVSIFPVSVVVLYPFGEFGI